MKLFSVFNLTIQQKVIGFTVGSFGAISGFLIGDWSPLLSFFLFAIVTDIITGCVASIYEGKGLRSSVGFKGLAKKFFMIVAVVTSHWLDMLMGTNVLMSGALSGYIALELLSIGENYGRIGLPLPKKVQDIIAVIKDKEK